MFSAQNSAGKHVLQSDGSSAGRLVVRGSAPSTCTISFWAMDGSYLGRNPLRSSLSIPSL